MPDPVSPDPLGGGAAPPPPDMSSMPLGGQVAPPAQPVAAPPAAVPDKHAMLGRFVSHVKNSLEGKQTQYVPDRTPDGALTGQVKEVQVPRRPGGFFRDLLGGMMAGMAASAAGPSGAAGLAKGFVGAQDRAQVTDSREKNRAVERAGAQKNTQDQEAAQKTQENVAQAAVAQSTLSSLDFGHNIGLHSDSDVDSHNNSVDVVRKAALDSGGALAQIQDNGKPGNGPALMEAYNKDPQSVMQAPDGFHRIPTITYDTNGLVHKGGKWTNQDGSPLDDDEWNKRATVSLIDLPNSAWGKRITLTKKSANDVAGRTLAQGNPTDSVSTDFGSLFGLGLKNLASMNKDRAALYSEAKTEAQKKDRLSVVEGIRRKLADGKEITPEEERKLDVWGPSVDEYDFRQQSPTKAQIDLETEKLTQQLREQGPKMDPQARATLLTRQQKEATKGVPDDIVAAIGQKPVPAKFDFGEDDPRYKQALKAWGEASLSKKAALQAQQGLARYQMLGNIHQYNVIDTDTKQMTAVNANQLNAMNAKNPGRYILATQDGTKAMSKTAAVKDVQSNIDSVRQSYPALDNLGPADRAVLIKALSDPDPSVVDNYMVGAARQISDPKQQQAVVDLVSLYENALLLRNIQGVTGNSDMVRRQVIAMVPGAASIGVKGFGEKQLDRFQKTVNQMVSGVPTPGHMTTTPEGGGRPGATNAKPDTHIFNASAWLKANPKGDVAAAKAAAKAQGFQVQE